jgi:hypothetical protein
MDAFTVVSVITIRRRVAFEGRKRGIIDAGQHPATKRLEEASSSIEKHPLLLLRMGLAASAVKTKKRLFSSDPRFTAPIRLVEPVKTIAGHMNPRAVSDSDGAPSA